MLISQSKKVWISIFILLALVFLAIGFVIGMLASKGVKLEGSLTYDGLASVIVGVVAIFAATVVLPIMVQPLFRKQAAVNTITQKNIGIIRDHLESVGQLLMRLNTTKDPVTDDDRQAILDLHSKISNYAVIINNHTKTLSALATFDADIIKPLSNAHTSFAELVVPGITIDDEIYLKIKQPLDSVLYTLAELQYDVN